MKRNVKGITLIALVITIIVLLILAGIAINLTIGNNGLFSRAQNAANIWKKAEVNEAQEMENFESLYDETVKNLGLHGNEEKENPLTKITGNETEKTDTTDKDGNRIVIPAGFKVINPEATVNGGIVIEDVSANNENTIGNQFVWVPCTLDGAKGSLKYDRYAFSRVDWKYSQTKLNEKDADGSYKIVRQDDVANGNNYYYHEAMPEQEKQSVQINGGYYIGRYEVGCETERTGHTAIMQIPKIQFGLNIYNYITINEARSLAEGIYEGKSRLCSSYAWGTALKFIDGNTGTYAVNSEGDNCGTNKLSKTGYHAEKNIYDMGGNVCEWISEKYNYTNRPYVTRGGCYADATLVYPSSSCHIGSVTEQYKKLGVRCTLYI